MLSGHEGAEVPSDTSDVTFDPTSFLAELESALELPKAAGRGVRAGQRALQQVPAEEEDESSGECEADSSTEGVRAEHHNSNLVSCCSIALLHVTF